MKNINKKKYGFTLIELLLVIAILGILSTGLLVGINPRRQMAKARDSERESHLQGIMSAILQYSAEHSGDLPDTDGDPDTSNFPTVATCIGTGVGCFNLAGAGETGDEIVPVYMASMPMDPKPVVSGEGTAANTGYDILVDANGRITMSATGEIDSNITLTK